jgi:SAM-dependent methyltransferase
MSTSTIRFEDGAGYEQFMGQWSRLVGESFLDWLAPKPGLRWLDVGCGNGAFTELIVQRCAPAAVHGVDPAEAQVAFARQRLPPAAAQFTQGDAMALTFPDDSFDAAVMPLVIFFVPEPARGVSEMVRVVRPGGSVSAYSWDLGGGGFPYEALKVALEGMGIFVPQPPSAEAARTDNMRSLWQRAGIEAIETREFSVERTFDGFDAYWETVRKGPAVGGSLGAMTAQDTARLQQHMRAILTPDARGKITCRGRANAVRGTLPK